MRHFIPLIVMVLLTANVFASEKEKYYSPTLNANFLLYVMDPDRVAGWALPLRGYEIEYMDKKYTALPVLGGWRDGGIPDKELLVKHRVRKALVVSSDAFYTAERSRELRRFNMDVTVLNAAALEDYIPLLRILGTELGIPERGEKLAQYGENAIAKTKEMAKDIPNDKKIRVFWALGSDGLATTCDASTIELAGGVSVHKCATAQGSERINFEQLMAYNPDVIIIVNPSGRSVLNDSKWRRLRAFREGKVYVVPYGPFGWMHNPEITRFMGIQWLACTLYPDRCSINIDEEAKEFTKLFMHIDITDNDLNTIMFRGKSGKN